MDANAKMLARTYQRRLRGYLDMRYPVSAACAQQLAPDGPRQTECGIKPEDVISNVP